MSFGQAVSTCFSKYATFAGRARRPEYWYWVLFGVVASIVLAIIDLALPFTHRSVIRATFLLYSRAPRATAMA
jgi:uncharacterized membrane protein YhaH (DUF805 family)